MLDKPHTHINTIMFVSYILSAVSWKWGTKVNYMYIEWVGLRKFTSTEQVYYFLLHCLQTSSIKIILHWIKPWISNVSRLWFFPKRTLVKHYVHLMKNCNFDGCSLGTTNSKSKGCSFQGDSVGCLQVHIGDDDSVLWPRQCSIC